MFLTQESELFNGRLFLGDSVVRVGDDNFCWCSVKNQDSNRKMSLKKNLVIAAATLILEENLIEDSLFHTEVAKIDHDAALNMIMSLNSSILLMNFCPVLNVRWTIFLSLSENCN